MERRTCADAGEHPDLLAPLHLVEVDRVGAVAHGEVDRLGEVLHQRHHGGIRCFREAAPHVARADLEGADTDGVGAVRLALLHEAARR